jgi:CBS domain-containing protein
MPTVEQIDRTVKRASHVLTVHVRSSIAEAARKMRDHDVGCLVVTSGSHVLGILTERDILSKVIARSRSPDATVVRDVMTQQVIACNRDTSITRARRLMAEYRIRHLPVIEKGVAVGMISSRDVLAHQLSEAKAKLRKQSKLLQELETEYPGITKLEKDRSGRLII